MIYKNFNTILFSLSWLLPVTTNTTHHDSWRGLSDLVWTLKKNKDILNVKSEEIQQCSKQTIYNDDFDHLQGFFLFTSYYPTSAEPVESQYW